MNFFKIHSGFTKVERICQLMVCKDQNNVQDEELQHIKGSLHQLKSEGFILVENEGADIYKEGFSSTPDRVEKYFSKHKIQDYSDLTKMSDQELEEIIRRNDNPGVATSLHNRALLELDLRHKKMLRESATGSKNKTTDEQEAVMSKIIGIHHQIDKIVDLDKKGLLERKELYDFKDKIENDIKQFITQSDDESQRHFKKITSGWKNMPKPGFTNPGEAEQNLKDIIYFINETSKRLSGKDFKTETYISAGRTFDGRVHLLNVLNTAKKEIFIIDNYLERGILSILSTVSESKASLKLKFLIGDKNKNKFDGFTADLIDFAQQYPLVSIECKLHNDLHDRYIIIDTDHLYAVGSSLDSLGGKGNFITSIDDKKSKDDHARDVLNLWNTAKIIPTS